jgi:hypothetical protein
MLRSTSAGERSGVHSGSFSIRVSSRVRLSIRSVFGVRTGQVRPGVMVHAGLVLMNLPAEWQVVDLGIETYGMTSVALYDTLGKDAVGECFRILSARTS